MQGLRSRTELKMSLETLRAYPSRECCICGDPFTSTTGQYTFVNNFCGSFSVYSLFIFGRALV